MAKEIITMVAAYFADKPGFIIVFLFCIIALGIILGKIKELDGYIGRVKEEINTEIRVREKSEFEIKSDAKDREERIITAIDMYRTFKEFIIEKHEDRLDQHGERIARLEGGRGHDNTDNKTKERL